MRILVVEDDSALREALVSVLQDEGYAVDETAAGDEGLYLAEQAIHDLLILDIMLPGMSGLQILKELRAQSFETPILLLTAKDSIADRVTGLETGADDYLVKPFAIPELLARVKALLRRKGAFQAMEEGISYGQEEKRYVAVHHPFTSLEFMLVNSERILTREQIFDRIWGFESDTTIGIVDLYVHYLRKKLAPFGCDTLVQTVRGVGYMLKEKEICSKERS